MQLPALSVPNAPGSGRVPRQNDVPVHLPLYAFAKEKSHLRAFPHVPRGVQDVVFFGGHVPALAGSQKSSGRSATGGSKVAFNMAMCSFAAGIPALALVSFSSKSPLIQGVRRGQLEGKYGARPHCLRGRARGSSGQRSLATGDHFEAGLLAGNVCILELLRAFDGHPVVASDAVGAETTRLDFVVERPWRDAPLAGGQRHADKIASDRTSPSSAYWPKRIW